MTTFQLFLLSIAFFILVIIILILFGFIISEIYKDIDEIENGPYNILDDKDKE